jgi:3-oxosteroid 1-dehydrogenase
MAENRVADAYDVVVVGSGAGGMVTAIRARDRGMSVALMEKFHHYGGTSATSGGGRWIPINEAIASEDSIEKAVTYLVAATGGKAREHLLRTYVENAPTMTKYVESVGATSFAVPGYPDYYPELPGAVASRAMLPQDFDGALLGDEFFRMRDHHPFLLAFNRYAMNVEMSAKLSAKLPGWRRTAAKMLWDYWSDIAWRRQTRRDRRLTMGRALVGSLRKAMMDRNIPLFLNMELVGLRKTGNRLTEASFLNHGRSVNVVARRGVVLAAGGYEQNQEMRDRYMEVATRTEASLTPAGANQGDAIRIGQSIGAAVENMQNAWWCPSIRLPSWDTPNTEISYPLFFERGRPGTISVNRLGRRFVNEAASYYHFGKAMIEDQKATGANNPCWMIMDGRFRSKHSAGGLLPSWVMPDKRVPQGWWDNIIYRANSITALADKVGVDATMLGQTVEAMNRSAKTGVDDEFHRGESSYDKFFGEMGITPNPCLGALDQAPFYAMRMELGDVGTKGGLRVDHNACVLDEADHPIPGLFAIGDTTGSPFADCYPGAGATLGPAMTFGYLAADCIARRAADAPAGTA